MVVMVIFGIAISVLITYLGNGNRIELPKANQELVEGTITIMNGKVLSWNSNTKSLLIKFEKQGIETIFELDPLEVKMVTYTELQEGKVDQVIIFNEDQQDFLTSFCIGDSVRLEFELRDGGNRLVKVVNNGPRKCW